MLFFIIKQNNYLLQFALDEHGHDCLMKYSAEWLVRSVLLLSNAVKIEIKTFRLQDFMNEYTK